MQLVDQLARPRAPLLAEQREIVVLEGEDGDAPLLQQHAHLAHHLDRLAKPHHLAGRGAIEGVDRAERAGARAAAAGQQRHRLAAEQQGRLVVPLRIRQGVQVRRQRAGLVGDDLAIPPPHHALDGAPVPAGAQRLDHLQERGLALIANHAVQLGHRDQRLLVAEARVVAAHGEMAVDARLAQHVDQRAVAADVELEDQREADQHRVGAPHRLEHHFRRLLDVDDLDREAGLTQRRSQVAEAEIALPLETYEHDGALRRRVRRPHGMRHHLVLLQDRSGRRPCATRLGAAGRAPTTPADGHVPLSAWRRPRA